MNRKTARPDDSTERTTSAKAPAASERRTRSAAAGPTPAAKPGTERARDEQRVSGGPRYGGGPWSEADARGDRRFGKARNDDANPSELARGSAADTYAKLPGGIADANLAVDAGAAEREVERGGPRAPTGRGTRSHKVKAR